MSWFSDADRAVLAELADVLIPAAEGMPAASAVGAVGPLLDRVVNFRPDLAPEVLRVVRACRGKEPQAALEQLRAADFDGYVALGLALAAGYYMADEVGELLGYKGPARHPITGEEDISDLLAPVLARGPIWRPTG